jgi:CBS domain-containing protein/sporulation protein YlmC with PRC-barrel domain
VFFLSRLLGQPVRDAQNKPAGTLVDLVVQSHMTYPRVNALVLKRRSRRVLAAWNTVSSFEESGSLLRVPAETLVDRRLAGEELLLSETFLDKQLVDRDGHKVIRINDIQLARTGPDLHVVAVDISSNAILRRVGLAKVGDRLVKKPKARLIDWRTVDLEESDAGAVRLTVPRRNLELLHPADIADLVHELTPEERAAVVEALADEVAADAVEEMHPSYQAALVGDLSDDRAAELISNMSPDDAADLLADLPDERRVRLLALMEKEDADDVAELLTYPEHSAGGIMTTDFAHVSADASAAEALQALREQEPDAETLYYVYVVDKGRRLRGVFSLRDLLVSPPEKKVRDFMTADPVAVTTAAGEEEVTQLIAKYNLLALPVVDEDNVLHGIITVDDAIDLILPLAWKKRLPRIFH